MLANTRGRGDGVQLRTGAMPFFGFVRVLAPSSVGGGGGLVGPGDAVWPHTCSLVAAARPREGFRGGHIAHGGRPSPAGQHSEGPEVG